MITLPSKTYTADAIRLSQILSSTTKVNMLKVCKKFDLYVSPNLKKDNFFAKKTDRCNYL